MAKVTICYPCMIGNCACREYDGADPEIVGWPPYHDKCYCYVIGTDAATDAALRWAGSGAEEALRRGEG